VRTPLGEVLIANIHTTAGGTLHPEDPRADRFREHQIDQLLKATDSSAPVVLAGDFNCGSVSTGNYQQLLNAGYSDSWTGVNLDDDGWTWEPTSSLNAGGTHSGWGCPAQRIDLVLLNASARRTWTVRRAERVFTEPSVAVDSGRTVNLSDHYGVLVTLVDVTAPAHAKPSSMIMSPS
jgi:endonuclease/exonuclease/phosphatase family metal-dependent hydrolase